LFDLRPFAIVKRFGLKNPIFLETAAYGHFGRNPFTRKEKFYSNGNTGGSQVVERDVEFFAWEKLDFVDKIKKEFGL